jgi:hypothetical protein
VAHLLRRSLLTRTATALLVGPARWRVLAPWLLSLLATVVAVVLLVVPR